MQQPGEANRPSDGFSRICLAIISRYKDYIEEKENLSVAELPTLVTPRNQRIGAKAAELKASMQGYDYDRDFREVALRAYNFVKEEIGLITLPLQFWLMPEETLDFRMGDSIDRNILLCSLLICLGNPSTRVLVRSSDSRREVVVYYVHAERTCLMDLAGSIKEFDSPKAAMESLRASEDETMYEFNDSMYADI